MSAPKGVSLYRYPARHDTAWMIDAACTGLDSELFFPRQGERIDPLVKHVCGACPVRVECLRHALATRADGVWGGVGEHDRRRLTRQIREQLGPIQ